MDSDSYGDGWVGGTEVFVTERETHSLLLGPDGEPLNTTMSHLASTSDHRHKRTGQDMISNRKRREIKKAFRAAKQTHTAPTTDLRIVTAPTSETTTRPTPERLARGVWSKTAAKDAGMLDIASDMIGRLGVEGHLTGQQVEAARVFQEARAGYLAEIGTRGYGSCLADNQTGYDAGDGNIGVYRAYKALENRIGAIRTGILAHEVDKLEHERPRNLEVLRNALNCI